MTHRDNCFPEVIKALDHYGAKEGSRVLELGPYTDIQFKRHFVHERGLKYNSIDRFQCNDENCYIGLMESLPFKDETFDIVFSCHAFEHTERPVETLREVLRVLKKGGLLLFVTPNYCAHHVVQADDDHINVCTELQMLRFLMYVKGWRDAKVFTQRKHPEWDLIEQDWNLITTAVKE